MKKVIKQDGVKGIFIYDDGSTAPIHGKETKKEVKKVIKKESKEVIDIEE